MPASGTGRTVRLALAEPLGAWLAVLLPGLPVLLLRAIPDVGAITVAEAEADVVRILAVHAGLFGYVAFATSLVLGARFPAVERLFGGLVRMYRFHRRLGLTVAALLTLHVTLMLSAAAVAGEPVTALLVPDDRWVVFAGVITFGGLVVVLVLTRLARLRHEPFLRVHRLLGLTFVVGAVHAVRVPAFSAQSPWLSGYLLAVTVTGVVAWTYRSGLGRTLVRRHFYEVADVRRLHPSVTALTLKPLEDPLDFAPGQAVFVGLDDDAVSRELHPFSITSAPGEPTLRLAIKAAGDFTTGVPAVTPGSLCRIEGPYGSFWQAGSDAVHQVWIAGGIGITPFLSMAHSLPDNDGRTIDLYYCTKDGSSAVFLDELSALTDRHPNLRVMLVPEDSEGFLRADRVRESSGDLSWTHIFLCGPMPMVEALMAQFEQLGVPSQRMHHEDRRLRGTL